MHQRQTSGLVRSLQGGEVHADQAPLVVEGEQSVRSIAGDEKPHWDGSLPRGGPLRRRGFLTRAQTHGAHLQAQLRKMQRSVVGYIFKDVQLFYGF